MFEEALDDALRNTFRNAQCSVRSVLNNDVEQVLLDLLLEDVIEKSLVAHIERALETDEAQRNYRRGC